MESIAMKQLSLDGPSTERELVLVPAGRDNADIALPGVLDAEASHQLMRMFRDPRVLELQERVNLIAQLRNAVELTPQVAEVKVLLGMALSVDLQAQEALEVLRGAARQAPDSFIARLKFGELLMRLRICRQAEEETHQAALLASNAAQSELARRQATAIRTMLREGVERGGNVGLLARIFRSRRRSAEANSTPVLATAK
jgi:tetratricopeptide (TPR) repeat protein